MKRKASAPYEPFLDEQLKDPELAANYFNEALSENDPELLKAICRDIARAQGYEKVAGRMKMHRENLMRLLSARGNPTLENLLKLISALGLKLNTTAKRSDAA